MAIDWNNEYNSRYGAPNLSSSNSNQVQDFNNLGGFNLPAGYNFNQNSMENNGIGERLATDNLAKLQLDPQSNYYDSSKNKSMFGNIGDQFSKLGITGAGMEGFGSAMQGLGSLASGWAAMKNLKLARQSMDNQQNQWNKNYESQRTTVNNQIDNQNAWKKAQGRTDYGKTV